MSEPLPNEAQVTDRRREIVESILGNLLAAGVITSVAIIAVGVVLLFVQNPGYLTASRSAHEIVATGEGYPHTPLTVLRGAVSFDGKAVIMLGVLLLIATPVLRVITSVAAFAFQRDWIFTVITSVVLCILLLAFWLGKL